MLDTVQKDPKGVRDFTVNWVPRLEGETIATSRWAGDLTVVTSSNTNNQATVRVSGGIDGLTYEMTNTVETSGGQTMQEILPVRVVEL